MRAVSRLHVLALVAATGLTLTGCADVNSNSATKGAPAPAATLAPDITKSVKTDLGEYLVKPRPGISAKAIQATVATLKAMPGVQSVDVKPDGRLDVQFLGSSTPDSRTKAVKQMAALGPVEQGI